MRPNHMIRYESSHAINASNVCCCSSDGLHFLQHQSLGPTEHCTLTVAMHFAIWYRSCCYCTLSKSDRFTVDKNLSWPSCLCGPERWRTRPTCRVHFPGAHLAAARWDTRNMQIFSPLLQSRLHENRRKSRQLTYSAKGSMERFHTLSWYISYFSPHAFSLT